MNGIALIPARGGSKGLPNKNLALLGGKSLIQRAVEAAQGSGAIERIVVSSDSEPILAAAEALGAEALRRPDALATDESSSDDMIAHAIDALGLAGVTDRPIVLLQPTSPLRTAGHVREAVDLWRAQPDRCVVSVFEPDHHPAKSFGIGEDGLLTGLFGPSAPFEPRQSLPRALMPNGAVYVFSPAAFLHEGRLPRAGLVPYLMDRRSSIDIDTQADLEEAERRLTDD